MTTEQQKPYHFTSPLAELAYELVYHDAIKPAQNEAPAVDSELTKNILEKYTAIYADPVSNSEPSSVNPLVKLQGMLPTAFGLVMNDFCRSGTFSGTTARAVRRLVRPRDIQAATLSHGMGVFLHRSDFFP